MNTLYVYRLWIKWGQYVVGAVAESEHEAAWLVFGNSESASTALEALDYFPYEGSNEDGMKLLYSVPVEDTKGVKFYGGHEE